MQLPKKGCADATSGEKKKRNVLRSLRGVSKLMADSANRVTGNMLLTLIQRRDVKATLNVPYNALTNAVSYSSPAVRSGNIFFV